VINEIDRRAITAIDQVLNGKIATGVEERERIELESSGEPKDKERKRFGS
jgi:hypothetical protein